MIEDITEVYILTQFHTINIYGRERYSNNFIKSVFYVGFWLDTLQTYLFKFGMMTEQTVQFSTSLNDFDFHSRPQGQEKVRTCAIILLESSMKLPKLVQKLIIEGRRQQKSLFSMVNMDHLICSLCVKKTKKKN